MTFGGCCRLRKTGSHTASAVSLCVISEEAGQHRLSKISRQRQNKINQQASQISSLEAQIRKFSQLLESKFLVETITQAVASNLNIGGKNTKPNNSSSGYTSKPYLGKPQPLQLAHGIDGSLDLALTCQYCKDTSHLKENCVKLTQRLALDKEEPGNIGASKPANNSTNNN